ncbi:amino acid ABC transporter permease [Desulfonatronum lacustre]|uniref:amino acid ABC transporter permease n=1 Tax=Desulfonatronum lacustre TaxID=66849 RepID=UPI00048FB08A|nr:amino acid ABC transporter permease [Desulfonatronum lacustre]SMP80370.1 amino acid ABC transporter membrane protein 2, PAAT family [Desulfonatronum zhilinae]
MSDYWHFFLNDVAPALNQGLWVSIAVIVPSALLGLALGVLVGSLRVYAPVPVRWLNEAYVSIFRGTPLVVQLFFWYFALPHLQIGDARIVLSPMSAAILGFTLCSGAYHSEYIRGALLSIRHGQIKAAQALGMTKTQTVLWVVLPQALRRALPGCGNEVIYLIKYSSLASIITLNELTGVGRTIAKQTWRNIEVFVALGLYYLLLVTLATLLLQYVERKMSLPGFEHSRE